MQVDGNMARAQKRDAAGLEKFFFRRNVFPPGQSSPCSSAVSSSGSSSPCNASRPKEKKLRNCFPVLQLPEEGLNLAPVEEEYEEMTMNEIMNGKVRYEKKMFSVF